MLEQYAFHSLIWLILSVIPNYIELEWPKDYWPGDNEKADAKMWNESVKNIKKIRSTEKNY